MALAWVLRDSAVTSALVGASRVEQLEQTSLHSQAGFQRGRVGAIEKILAG